MLVVWGAREHPELKGIPLITSLAKTPEHKQALQLALARLEFGRPFFMPPNVPPARVAAMRRAFDATLKDPEFLAEADKLKLEIDPISGEELAKMLEEMAKTPADVIARVRTAYEVKLGSARRQGLHLQLPRQRIELRDHLRIDRHAVARALGAALEPLLAGQADRIDARQLG